MSYDPPTIMDKLHAIARALGIDDVDDCASLVVSADSLAGCLGALVGIGERIATALESIAEDRR